MGKLVCFTNENCFKEGFSSSSPFINKAFHIKVHTHAFHTLLYEKKILMTDSTKKINVINFRHT